MGHGQLDPYLVPTQFQASIFHPITSPKIPAQNVQLPESLIVPIKPPPRPPHPGDKGRGKGRSIFVTGILYTVQCTVGGFNVSNLMGVKRRKIAIGKKITFYFLQNV
jgi:hypothetical protein